MAQALEKEWLKYGWSFVPCAPFKDHVKKKEVWFLPLMQVANLFIDLFNYKGMHETNENFKGDHDNWQE